MQELETFWTVVGKGAAILGVIVAIIQGIKYLYKETPTAKLEARIVELEDKKEKDYQHLKKHDEQIEEIKEKIDDTDRKIEKVNEGVKKIGKSQIVLLRHMIDGNGVDKMAEEAQDLTDFFIER